MTAPSTVPAATVTPRPLALSGRALHSGVPSTVTVSRRDDDGRGLRLRFPGFAAPLTARDLVRLRRSARRATVLTDPVTGATIRTPEHLLAAALFFAQAPLDVACDAEEIPGLDGSAAPWCDLLARAAHPEASPSTPILAPAEYETGLTWSCDGPEGRLVAEPAPHFSVQMTLRRGAFAETFTLEAARDARTAVLPARTFIFWSDWQRLQATAAKHEPREVSALLLEGAAEDSGMLLAQTPEEFARARADLPTLTGNAFPLLHPRAFRLEAEAARHKVLDLLGDLALNGLALPRLRLTIENGGHALNHLLLDALLARGSARTDTRLPGDAS